jgi:Flp pilus assembly protein TadG
MLKFARSRTRGSESGQGLVEFAFVLPVLLVIMLGIVQLGWIFTSQIGVTNGIREAARYAATNRTANTTQAAANAAFTVAQLNTIMPRNVKFFAAANVGAASTTYCEYTDPKGEPAVRVRVTVQYRHPLFLPIVGPILDGVDGVADNALLASATEEMRVENTPALSSSTGISSC